MRRDSCGCLFDLPNRVNYPQRNASGLLSYVHMMLSRPPVDILRLWKNINASRTQVGDIWRQAKIPGHITPSLPWPDVPPIVVAWPLVDCAQWLTCRGLPAYCSHSIAPYNLGTASSAAFWSGWAAGEASGQPQAPSLYSG